MKRLNTAGATALLLASASLAQAQDQAPESDFAFEDIIVVEGRYLSIDKVNAVKTPTPIINVPQSLSIVDDIQIEAQGFTSIGDITRYTPGLTTSQGEGHRDAIIIRGQQTTADFFQDGIRDDVQYYRPLYNLERVEILRGANALLFGRGGTGGIVNRVTKKPELNGQETTLSASIDTFGAFQISGDTDYTLTDTVGLRLNGFVEELNNHRDFYDGTRFGLNPTLRVDILPDTTVDLSYEYLDDDRVVDRGVPSQNLEGDADGPLKGYDNTFFGSPDENFTTLQAHILRGRVDHRFSDSVRGNLTAQYADYDKLYQNLYASEEVLVDQNGDFDQVELDGYRDATDRQNLFLQGNLVGEFKTGEIGHTVLMGAEYGRQDTINSRIDNVFEANGDDQLFIDFSDPLVIPAFSFSNPARDRASDVTVLSIYAQDQIALTDQFKVILGGRFDSFDIDVSDFANDAAFSRKDEQFSPRFGAIYKPAENVSFYASYSETFLPRSGDQFLTLNLTNSQTEPQGFENKEIGLKYDIQPNLHLTLALFDLEQANFLTQDIIGGDQDVQVNVQGSNTQGFEVQLQGDLTDRWAINAGYTYVDGAVEFPGSTLDQNRTRQTPNNTFSIWNQYQISDKFSVGAGAAVQDSFFVREDNSVEVPGYTRFDAAAFYDVTDGLRVQLNIENALDIDYFPDAHSNDNITVGAPINARLTVRSTF
jgi:catecholate siderophore receptor